MAERNIQTLKCMYCGCKFETDVSRLHSAACSNCKRQKDAEREENKPWWAGFADGGDTSGTWDK